MLPLVVAYSHSQALDMGLVPMTWGDLLDVVMADFDEKRTDIEWLYTPPDASEDALQGPLGMDHFPFTAWTERRVYGSLTFRDDHGAEQFVISSPRGFEIPEELDGQTYRIVNTLLGEHKAC